MIIKNLEVCNFRCHDIKKIKPSKNKTVIYGLNGSGKTSLIEAIYLLFRGKSFRGYDANILNLNSDWYRASLTLEYNQITEVREVRFKNQQTKNKEFRINQTRHRRIPIVKKIPIVLFQPEDLNLINGSPNRRRVFFDELISQLRPEHTNYINRYEKALKQRNNLIKNNPQVTENDLFSWNVILSNYGAKIITNRLEVIQLVKKQLEEIYFKITNKKDTININYSEKYSDISQIQQKIFNHLSYQPVDQIGTPFGPHRDDFIINFNALKATQHTSRGENRSIVLSLKIIEANLIKDKYNFYPVILLDDVLSELDEKRREYLLKYIKNNQVIITSTETIDLKSIKTIKI